MTWLLVLATGLTRIANSQTMVESKHNSQIIFVCEHGAALSVVSAAYFNKIALEKHLNLHAIARGIEPQKDLSVSARHGLDSDVEWQIEDAQGLPFTTVNTAIRYVLEARDATRDPIIRNNADQTLTKLKTLH